MDRGPRQFAVVPKTSLHDAGRFLYRHVFSLSRLCRENNRLIIALTFSDRFASLCRPFSIEFELGLELDSAEVRGILIHEGEECGRVVFDFLN